MLRTRNMVASQAGNNRRQMRSFWVTEQVTASASAVALVVVAAAASAASIMYTLHSLYIPCGHHVKTIIVIVVVVVPVSAAWVHPTNSLVQISD